VTATQDEVVEQETMSLTEHLAELRVRIIRAGLAVVLASLVIIAFYDLVYDFLVKPYDDLCSAKPDGFCSGELNAFSPTEGFSARLRIGMYGGIFIALPVILWQIWRFVVPALEAKEKKYAIPFVLSSVVLFSAGGTLAYLTIGRALDFLISWSGAEVEQVFAIEKYFALVGFMVFAFGIGFLLPVLLVFLQLVGIVTPRQLIAGWRFAIVGIFVVAAVITPSGDPITLLTLSVPMGLLYFVAIGIGWLVGRRRASKS
jgi:sec-independent protein translocase protein TatC